MMAERLGGALVEEITPAPEPIEACARFLDLPGCLLLESMARSKRLGRYSFLAADPFVVLRSEGALVEQVGAAGVERIDADPFTALQRALARYRMDTLPGLPPFQGGAAGYFGYELGRHLETLPEARYDDLAVPDLCIGFYDWVLAWDHTSGRAWLISTGLPATGPERWSRAEERAGIVRARLQAASSPREHLEEPAAMAPARERPPTWPVPGLEGVASTFSRDAYLAAVARAREYILAGDIFQVNLSQRLQAPYTASPFALYRAVQRRNPAPFAAYYRTPDATIVSASPERFLRVSGGRVETRPIKGTAPRGINPMHDTALALALRESEKDRAENVMIVDLLRNDLSRVCEDHSVEVPELCTVESFSSVHHLVSTVVGRLRPDHDAVDVLRAAFPGGSITGAPKVRAMEIIAEIEPTRRGPYTGAIGYIGFDGAMDTNIAIRTFIVKEGTAYFQVGGGIVADSDPVKEYLETLAKAKGLLEALEAHRGAADR
ncbi:MAG TPA: aminodeoxychorismate synthase component I [Longimicrobiales bacterium]